MNNTRVVSLIKGEKYKSKKLSTIAAKSLNDEFNALMHKYKIESCVMIVKNNLKGDMSQTLAYSHLNNGTGEDEKNMAYCLLDIFSPIKLNSENLKALASFVEIASKPQPKTEAELREEKLSPAKRKILLRYRELKAKYVNEQNYQKAAEYRDKERKILNSVKL